MIRVEYTLEGLPEVKALLAKVDEAINTREILDQAQAILLNRIRDRFLRKIDPDGTEWIPSRAGQRRAAMGMGDTLYDTGNLWRSIQLHSINDQEAVIGTNVEYGPELQLGSIKVGPARVFMGFGESDVEAMQTFLEHRFDELVK